MTGVTNVASMLKKSMNSTTPINSAEVKQRKKSMLGIVDTALDQFRRNLESGKVELDSSIDLERLIKCALILSGEADSITGKPNGQTEQHKVEISKIAEVLDENDPMVQTLFNKLYEGYNKLNDADE